MHNHEPFYLTVMVALLLVSEVWACSLNNPRDLFRRFGGGRLLRRRTDRRRNQELLGGDVSNGQEQRHGNARGINGKPLESLLKPSTNGRLTGRQLPVTRLIAYVRLPHEQRSQQELCAES